MLKHILPLSLLLAACSQQAPAQQPAGKATPPAAARALSTFASGFAATPCPADYKWRDRPIECGTMTVPETRGKADSRMVSFPVVIVRSTDAKRQPDPVIFLHGGPGGGYIEDMGARFSGDRLSFVTADRDWIFFNERGVGAGEPVLDCGTAPLSDAGVTSDAGVAQLQACGLRLAKTADLSQYNSATIVQDVADLRAALQIKAYNLFGGSYGARVALAFLAHDPSDLRSVVLDSAWPPEANATAPLPGLVSRETRKVLRKCAADATCNAQHPNLEKRLDAFMTQWLAKPPSGHTADVLAAFLLDALYGERTARALPADIDRILHGDTQALDYFARAQADYKEGQFFTHLCKEEFPFEKPEEIVADPKDPIAVATARDTRRFFAACKGFDVGGPDPVENQPVKSDVPVLLLSGDIDAGCPAELSLAAVKHLSKGQAFVFPNRTHGVTRQSDCAVGMVRGFYADPTGRIDPGCVAKDQPKLRFLDQP